MERLPEPPKPPRWFVAFMILMAVTASVGLGLLGWAAVETILWLREQ